MEEQSLQSFWSVELDQHPPEEDERSVDSDDSDYSSNNAKGLNVVYTELKQNYITMLDDYCAHDKKQRTKLLQDKQYNFHSLVYDTLKSVGPLCYSCCCQLSDSFEVNWRSWYPAKHLDKGSPPTPYLMPNGYTHDGITVLNNSQWRSQPWEARLRQNQGPEKERAEKKVYLKIDKTDEQVLKMVPYKNLHHYDKQLASAKTNKPKDFLKNAKNT